MSTVSASVTRRPLRNSVCLPSRDIRSLICGPPPCTTTGRIPTRRISTTSSANSASASCSRRAGERVAAVLDDDDLAGEAPDVRQRLDQRRRLLGGDLDHSVAHGHGDQPTGQAGRLVEAERDVGGLHGAAAGALGEVVEGGDRDHGAGARVVARGDVHRVRAERRLRRRRAVGHDHERLVREALAERSSSASVVGDEPVAGRA